MPRPWGFVPDDIDDEESEVSCRYCKTLVYWADHYDAEGSVSRRLFTASSRRLHDCRVKPDADAFDVVVE